MEKKERDMEKPVGTHMNPTGTLHRDTRIYKEGHGNSRKGRGGQWGRNLGTLPAGETDVTLGDAILGQKFPRGAGGGAGGNEYVHTQRVSAIIANVFMI